VLPSRKGAEDLNPKPLAFLPNPPVHFYKPFYLSEIILIEPVWNKTKPYIETIHLN